MKPLAPDVEARRRMVASMMLQGFGLDTITEGLVTRFLNPKTSEPYSRASVYRDMLALKRQWRTEAMADIAELRGRQLAEIAELKKEAWAKKDLSEVRMLLDREARLLGLDAPVRVDVTMLARTLAEEAAKLAGLSPEATTAVGDRAAELAQ
jgi:hypothetical protein